MHQVYISYSSWDKPVADVVCRELEAAKISCWIAPRDVYPGADWSKSISEAIGNCQLVVLILSSRSNNSRNIHRELERAIASEKQIIPMLVEDFQPTGPLQYHISTLHWLDASQIPLTDAVEKLSKNILQTLQLTSDLSQNDLRSKEVKRTIPQRHVEPAHRESRQIKNFDVFISYRRATDAQTARLIRSEIQIRGYKVFLDVDDLRPGHFDEALIERIKEANNFIIILSKDALKNCVDPEDWMRKEIVCAISEKKNIIPIMMKEFAFPRVEELPQELQSLSVHHGIEYSHQFFDAMMEKIVDYLEKQ